MLLVAATANPHKLEEIAAILAGRVTLAPRPPGVADVDEHGDTLEANAALKAHAIAAAAGLPALADDTGLEVEALGGAPGVRSARYAGEGASDADNVARLLDELAGSAGTQRRARFRTVVVVAWPDGREVVADGVVEGHIAEAPRGSGGFGYDPVFVADDAGGRTFAELDAAEKNAISHRTRALAALLEALGSQPGTGDERHESD